MRAPALDAAGVAVGAVEVEILAGGERKKESEEQRALCR